MASAFRIGLSGLALLGLGACANEHAPLASTSPCPPYVNYPADIHANDPSPYLGCSNRANLEQMVEDKRDLEVGRTLGPADGAREAKAVKDYKEGKTKTSTGSSSTTGAGLLLQGTGTTGTTQ